MSDILSYISLITTSLSNCILSWFQSDIGLVFCGIYIVFLVYRLVLIIFDGRG